MISAKELYDALAEESLDFYTGVPDSLLRGFIAHVAATAPAGRHLVAANEGNAVALAAGQYLASGRPGVVYLQNSGLGNCVNPLTSLCAEEALCIPVLLLVGWRGEPGTTDEPQHRRQGRVTLPLLEALAVPYRVLPDTPEGARSAVREAAQRMADSGAPYALVVRRGTLSGPRTGGGPDSASLRREEAIRRVVAELDPETLFVATTGKAARELFELREAAGQTHGRDLLVVGSMGHASSIAQGLALERPDRRVCCLDGDGALIMHLGALATIGRYPPENLLHLVLDNQAYDSVGGQPTASANLRPTELALASGYRHARSAETEEDLVEALRELSGRRGPALLHVRVARGARPDLGRPTRSPQQNRVAFMDRLDDR